MTTSTRSRKTPKPATRRTRKPPVVLFRFESKSKPDTFHNVCVAHGDSVGAHHLWCTCEAWRRQTLAPDASVRSCTHVASACARILASRDDNPIFEVTPEVHRSIAGFDLVTSKAKRAIAIRAFAAESAIKARVEGWQKHAEWILGNDACSRRLVIFAAKALMDDLYAKINGK